MSVSVDGAIEPVAREWDELADRMSAAPFLRPGWFDAWWRAFGSGELVVLSLRRGGRFAGVLPMARRRGVLHSLTNYHTPAFGPLAEDLDAARELAAEAMRQAPRRISLTMVDEEDAALGDYESAARRAGYRVLTRTQARMPVVELTADWPARFEERPRKFRKELRRCRRRLEEHGTVRLDTTADPERLDARIQEAFALENTGWKRDRGTAMSARPETRRFYEDVARWAAARGFLRLLFLRLDEVAVAVDYCLEAGGVRHMLKGGFDPDYGSSAPGHLLLEDGLAQAAAAGVERVELGGGDDPYKLRWTESVRERRLLQAFAASPLGLADWAAISVGRPAAKRLLSRLREGRELLGRQR